MRSGVLSTVLLLGSALALPSCCECEEDGRAEVGVGVAGPRAVSLEGFRQPGLAFSAYEFRVGEEVSMGTRVWHEDAPERGVAVLLVELEGQQGVFLIPDGSMDDIRLLIGEPPAER